MVEKLKAQAFKLEKQVRDVVWQIESRKNERAEIDELFDEFIAIEQRLLQVIE